jgi:hypothetical protein
MKTYMVYYKLNGKQYKTRIEANSKTEAADYIKSRLIICKVVEEPDVKSVFDTFRKAGLNFD